MLHADEDKLCVDTLENTLEFEEPVLSVLFTFFSDFFSGEEPSGGDLLCVAS